MTGHLNDAGCKVLTFTPMFNVTVPYCGKSWNHGRLTRWCSWSACDVGEVMQCKGWRMSRAPSVVSATSHLKWAEPLLLFQLCHTSNEQSPFCRFSYVTPQMSRAPSVVSAMSCLKWTEPLPSLQLHHTSFTTPFIALLRLHHRHFTYVTWRAAHGWKHF